jgi:hypothetical protein
MVNQEDSKSKMDKLKKEVESKKTKKDEDFARQIATRELLERDFNEDFLKVSFNTSPDTRRAILARKPNQEEFLKILKLSIEASNLESSTTEDANKRLMEVYMDLNKIASELSVDESLDEEFWSKNVSFETLQNFISELILSFQQGTRVSEEDMKSFR